MLKQKNEFMLLRTEFYSILKFNWYFIIFMFFIFLSPHFSFASEIEDTGIINPVPNPSVVYCEELGYKFLIKDTPEGQLGICRISDSVEASAWKFLRGEDAVEYNYCTQKGYKTKISSDPKKCQTAVSSTCSVCVLDDGQEIEALDFITKNREDSEVDCNLDGKCSDGETIENCPKDCIQGNNEDSINLIKIKSFLFIAFGLLLVLIFIIIYIFYKKRERMQ